MNGNGLLIGLGTATAAGAVLLSKKKKKKQVSTQGPPVAPPSSCPALTLDADGTIAASKIRAAIGAGQVCVFDQTYKIRIETFDDLRYFGQFISAQMFFRAGAEQPGHTVDVTALAKVETWIKGCRWLGANLEWHTIQDKMEEYQIAHAYHSAMRDSVSNSDEINRSTLTNEEKKRIFAQRDAEKARLDKAIQDNFVHLKALVDMDKAKFPPGSMPVYEHFVQVLSDYSNRGFVFLFDGGRYSSEGYPKLMFGNYRWQLGLPADRYNKILYAFEPAQWCAESKDEIWRDPDPNGWKGGWIRPPYGHPYHDRNCDKHTVPWSVPGDTNDEAQINANSLNSLMMPRLFALAMKTLVFEYAAAHFLQTIYLATINTNAAKENTKAAFDIGGKGLALAGGIAGAAASTGVGTVGAVITAAIGLISAIVQWALSFGLNAEREKMARARAANLLRKNLARFDVRVDQFFGWNLRVNYPQSGMGDRTSQAGIHFRLNEQSGELEAVTEEGTAHGYTLKDYPIVHDPWFYFRIPYTATGGVPQVPLLILRPDFDFAAFSHYRVDSSKIYAIRVSDKYQDKHPRQTYEWHWMDMDLKGLKTPKAWGAT